MKRILLLLLCICVSIQLQAQPVKFAVISDIHSDIMHDAKKRLQNFLDAAQKANVDFIIDLGDFAMVKPENQYMVDLWNSFPGDKHHVIGNHDTDNCNKEQFMDFVGMPSRYFRSTREIFISSYWMPTIYTRMANTSLMPTLTFT